MEALQMLAPDDRNVRGKLQLFLRLWVARQKYETLKPFAETPQKRLKFHLEQLQACWDHVIEAQRSLGMEVELFHPTDKFELIYVISAFVEREMNSKQNAVIGLQAKWSVYESALNRLEYKMNVYDFADACVRCQQVIWDMRGPQNDSNTEIIRLDQKHIAQLNGMGKSGLRINEHHVA
jgi:hypothetical protein